MPSTLSPRPSVDCIIDASTLINLDNARALDVVTTLSFCRFYVSPAVVVECQPTGAARIAQLAQDGRLGFVDPSDVPAEAYLSLLAAHDLGEGETECIALALFRPFVFCCDDGKARRVAASLIGSERVIGSLRLLKWTVEKGILSVES